MGVEGANVSELCRRFGVSRKTAYKWRTLFEAGESLADRSRRPDSSPRRSSTATEEAVVSLRTSHPTWGGRKISALLAREGAETVPSPSAVTKILRRRGLLDGPGSDEKRDFERFERESPNELWQMDFKGHFALGGGGRCRPLTLLDDHSRFLLGVWACENERADTVRPFLERAFRLYGLPQAILCDNGGPWSSRGAACPSALEAWLLRLGVRPVHGRPYHPQTQGKLERFHRTLLADAIAGRTFSDLRECQLSLEKWREAYNRERPHEAIGMAVPASRYAVSRLAFPEEIPEPPADPSDLVRRVQKGGGVSLHGREFHLGDGLAGQPVALRPLPEKGACEIRFCGRLLAQLELGLQETTVTYVRARV